MEKLQSLLDSLINELDDPTAFRERVETLISSFPFNEYEFIISTLLGKGILTIEDYYQMREAYIARNMYLYIFEISAPRGFGESWAQGHIKALVPDLQKPSRKLDANYSGQYDFLLNFSQTLIKIEVKASRAVDANSREPLYVKALSSTSGKPFNMNFQQIKPRYCDVFIWVAVWRDKIRYWVLASKEVENHRYYSVGQHRGNVGEGQLHITQDNIADFAKYEVRSDKLLPAIIAAYKRQHP